MKALIQALADDLERRRAEAAATYRELLQGDASSLSPKDMARFKDAAGLLGKGLDQVGADFKQVEEARRRKLLAETLPAAAKAHEDANQAVTEHAAEMDRVREQMMVEHHRLLAARDQALSAWQTANQAKDQFQQQKLAHAELLQGIDLDLPPEPELERGGPFEVIAPRPFNDNLYGVPLRNGVGRTDVVAHARHLMSMEGEGWVVRDLSKQPKAEPAKQAKAEPAKQPAAADREPAGATA